MKTIGQKWILFFVSCLFFITMQAQDVKTIFQTANTYYKNKQYEEAEKMYALLLQKEKGNVNVFYNLGNTYFHLNDFPKAVLYYEKALKMQPDNQHILHNIKETNNKLFSKMEFSKEFFVTKQLKNVVQSKSANKWSVYMLIALWLGVIAICIHFFFGRKNIFQFGLLSLIIAAVFAWLTYHTYSIEHQQDYAIILQKNAFIKSAPVESLNKADSIQTGLKVQILDSDKSWLKVKLPNDKTGWIEKKSLGLI